jgi:hypothetical protein
LAGCFGDDLTLRVVVSRLSVLGSGRGDVRGAGSTRQRAHRPLKEDGRVPFAHVVHLRVGGRFGAQLVPERVCGLAIVGEEEEI